MKEIKKEIQTIDYKTVYEATDGTTFENKEECRKYEASARGMMRAKVKQFMSKPKDAWTTMGGWEDHQVLAVSIPDDKAVDTIAQWLFLEHPWYLIEGNQERREEVVKTISTAFMNNDVLLFGLNCEDEYYLINSRQNIIDNLMNLDKEEKKDTQL